MKRSASEQEGLVSFPFSYEGTVWPLASYIQTLRASGPTHTSLRPYYPADKATRKSLKHGIARIAQLGPVPQGMKSWTEIVDIAVGSAQNPVRASGLPAPSQEAIRSAFALPESSSHREGRAEALRLLSELEALEWQKWGNPFMTEITKQNCAALGVPEYFKIVKNKGMSLPAIRRKLKEDPAYSFNQFREDVGLIVRNATTYNHPGEEVYNMALDLQARFDVMLAASPLGSSAAVAEDHAPPTKRGRTPPPP